MEPWDGPAAMAFSDGRQIGATLDRNGLRPARYFETSDGLVVMSSEAGVLSAPGVIVRKWRRSRARCCSSISEGRIISDDELKADLSASILSGRLDRTQLEVSELPTVKVAEAPKTEREAARSPAGVRLHGRSSKFLMTPMAETGQEASRLMGADTALSALLVETQRAHLLQQNFAQVTNPPIDTHPRGASS